MPRPSLLRGTVIGPTLIVLAVVAAYAAVTLLWPLTAVMPTAQSVDVAPLTASAAAPAWPAEGSAAVAVDGFESTSPEGTLTSTTDAAPLASITKLVTALMVLDRLWYIVTHPSEFASELALAAEDTVIRLFKAKTTAGQSHNYAILCVANLKAGESVFQSLRVLRRIA